MKSFFIRTGPEVTAKNEELITPDQMKLGEKYVLLYKENKVVHRVGMVKVVYGGIFNGKHFNLHYLLEMDGLGFICALRFDEAVFKELLDYATSLQAFLSQAKNVGKVFCSYDEKATWDIMEHYKSYYGGLAQFANTKVESIPVAKALYFDMRHTVTEPARELCCAFYVFETYAGVGDP